MLYYTVFSALPHDELRYYLRPETVSNRIIKKKANCEFFAIGNHLRIFLAILPVAFSMSGS